MLEMVKVFFKKLYFWPAPIMFLNFNDSLILILFLEDVCIYPSIYITL